MSRPNSSSTDLPSSTVNEQGRWRLPNLIWAECIRPKILAVPTPIAMPWNRVSSSRMILLVRLRHLNDTLQTYPQASAHSGETAHQPDSRRTKGIELTDGALCSRVDERLDGVTIDFHVDVQHRHATEGFRLGKVSG